jgi:hypothetical protein
VSVVVLTIWISKDTEYQLNSKPKVKLYIRHFQAYNRTLARLACCCSVLPTVHFSRLNSESFCWSSSYRGIICPRMHFRYLMVISWIQKWTRALEDIGGHDAPPPKIIFTKIWKLLKLPSSLLVKNIVLYQIMLYQILLAILGKKRLELQCRLF